MASDPRVWLAEAQERAEEYRPTMDLEVVHDWAGESVNDTIKVTAALTAVLDLHVDTALYEPCIPSLCDQPEDDHLETSDGEWVHSNVKLATACGECRDTDGSVVDYPCPTARAITDALGGDRG